MTNLREKIRLKISPYLSEALLVFEEVAKWYGQEWLYDMPRFVKSELYEAGEVDVEVRP